MLVPRPYQQRCVDAVYIYYRTKDGSPIVCVPTGGGKSLIIAMLCHDLVTRFKGQRILVLSHVKELVAQDHDKLKEYWTNSPAGIYSASLGKRQAHHAITFATIQSVHKKAHILGHRDILILDECHLLSPKDGTMYQRLIAGLRQINPRMKVLGLSATPYRLDSGYLHEGDDSIFTDICINVPIMELLEAKYLCPLVGKSSCLQVDLSKLGKVGGDWNTKQMGDAFERDGFTEAVLDEALPLAVGRKAVLVFCSTVAHATHVRDSFRARGEVAEMVSGETPAEERDEILLRFKAGKIRFLTSVMIVCVGFDAPIVDCIILLRATQSPGLFVQMLGRGLRLHPGKQNCLVLDHSRGLETHGPITHIQPRGHKQGKGKKEDVLQKPKVRICEYCRTASSLETLECPDCGNPLVKERDPTEKLDTRASNAPIMMTDAEYLDSRTTWAEVDKIYYHRHKKEGKPDSMRVEYQCGMMIYKEWVCFEHGGYATQKAHSWWYKRMIDTPPATTDEAIRLSAQLREPSRIRVKKVERNFEVIDYDFTPATQKQLALGA